MKLNNHQKSILLLLVRSSMDVQSFYFLVQKTCRLMLTA
nr:MAG TPA: hypothetical protein [Caudoviricetes sp.]